MSENNASQAAEGSFISNITEGLSARKAVLYVALYGGAAIWIIPYLWMITSSVKTSELLFSSVPHWIPTEVTLQWYALLLQDTLIVQWTINTFIVAFTGSVMVMIIDSMAAFSLTRLDWRGQNVILTAILASFMVPGVVNLIPVYTLLSNWGLINSYAGVILPGAANAFGVFMLVQFFKDIPDELSDAARLDGFSAWRRYLRIVVPMRSSAIASLGLFWFIWSWNSFLWPLIILQDKKMFTLPIGLVTLTSARVYQPGLTMASAIVAAVPLLILFILLQNYLVKAVAMQGTVQ